MPLASVLDLLLFIPRAALNLSIIDAFRVHSENVGEVVFPAILNPRRKGASIVLYWLSSRQPCLASSGLLCAGLLLANAGRMQAAVCCSVDCIGQKKLLRLLRAGL